MLFYVQEKQKSPSTFSPNAPPHTIVSFLFPKEHRAFLSFLVLCVVGEDDGDDTDVVDDDEERGEGDIVVGLLHSEAGAD